MNLKGSEKILNTHHCVYSGEPPREGQSFHETSATSLPDKRCKDHTVFQPGQNQAQPVFRVQTTPQQPHRC